MDIPQIDVDELIAHRSDGATVLDVRNPGEFEEAHVPGAVLIPLGELADRLDDVPRVDGTLYVICRSGNRSQRACELLATRGLDVANVAGGMIAWINAGQPVADAAGPG